MKRRRKTYRRGRTRPERAALLDALFGDVLPLPDVPTWRFVDVGYGDEPTTTERTHETLLQLSCAAKASERGGQSAPSPNVETVGVEADHARVSRAQERSTAGTRFVLGGFALTGVGIQDASLIRCLNVLRGYGLWDVKPALLQMSRALVPGGLLLEGTSDAAGTLAAVHVWRRNNESRMNYNGLVCVTDFSRGFSPWMFRDVLPRDLRRHATPGEPVFEWLKTWDNEMQLLRTKRREGELPRAGAEVNHSVFEESVKRLTIRSPETDARFASRGVVVWKPERPSTRPEVLCPDDRL